MAIAASPMPASAAELPNSKASSPGLVVVHDGNIKDYLQAHPEHPLNLDKPYVLPDGKTWSNYEDQQRQIFAWHFHAKVPEGPAGDRFINWVKATHPGQRVVVTDPRPEVIEFRAHYTIINDVLRFQLNAAAASQTNHCQDQPIYPNAVVAAYEGFVTQATIGHVPSLPLKEGARGYSDSMMFDRAVVGRSDLSATIIADGRNHLQAMGPAEIKVSRQIMLKKNASNLATYTTCINKTYQEPGCLKIEGVPDQENGRAGWAQIWFTNNRYSCQLVTQPAAGGVASPPEVDTGSPEIVTSPVELPTLDTPGETSAPGADYWLPEGSGEWGGAGTYLIYPCNGFPPGGGGFPPGGGGGSPGGAPVSTAPEPDTWVLVMAGIGLAGGLLRRNKQAPSP